MFIVEVDMFSVFPIMDMQIKTQYTLIISSMVIIHNTITQIDTIW